MIYESRIYKAVPGKLPAINARFANHTIGFFEAVSYTHLTLPTLCSV